MIIHNAMEEFYYYFDNNFDLLASEEIKRIVTERKIILDFLNYVRSIQI